MENNGLNLTAENISFGYPGQKPIISDLSFKLRGGEILGLAGQNGAGKSTLLDLLAGIKEPTQGQIKVLGLENESGRRKRIALLPQNVDFFILGDTPREDLELALSQLPNLSDVKSDKLAKNSDSPSINDIVTTIAKRWALLDLLDSPVETLSLGQKKRLALASSMAVEPAVLLLDEPFSGLDWPGSLNFLEDLRTLPEKRLIVILATHEPSLVSELVSQWLLMKPNQYLFGSPNEVFKHLSDFGVRPLGK